MGIRSFTPQVTACPGCGRTTSTFFQEMAEQIQTYLREQMPVWKGRYIGVEEMKVAVMGCVVNGPGESKHANIGISLPGTFEEPKAPVYVDGRLMTTLKGDRIVAEFIEILDDYVDSHYAAREAVNEENSCQSLGSQLPIDRSASRLVLAVEAAEPPCQNRCVLETSGQVTLGAQVMFASNCVPDRPFPNTDNVCPFRGLHPLRSALRSRPSVLL